MASPSVLRANRVPVAVARVSLLAVVLATAAVPTAVLAQEPTTTASAAQEADPEQLQAGAEVFQTVCAGCHQPNGAGIPERFPPLKDNPNVSEPGYVEQVVQEGRQGEIVVNGVTYDGIMSPLTGLSDEEIEAVAAYVRAGFEVPGGAQPDVPPASGTVAAELPLVVVAASTIGILLGLGVVGLVLAPMVLGTTDRLHLPWLDAWLKTAVIVAYFVIATAVLPSLLLKSEVIDSLPGTAQDLIGAGVWAVAVGAGLWGLWWAQRRNRI